MSPEVQDRVAALRSEGKSYDEMAAITGLSKATISRYVYNIRRHIKPYARAEQPKETVSPEKDQSMEDFREMLCVDIGTGGVRTDRRGEVIPWLT
jgi:transposase